MNVAVNRRNYFESTVSPEWQERFRRRLDMWNRMAYPEPLSALWTEKATVNYRVIETTDPLWTRIDATAKFKMHDWTLPTLKKINKTGHRWQRSGGLYHPLNVKRMQRKVGNAATLEKLTRYWEPYLDQVQEELVSLFEYYKRKTVSNIERIRSDPELAVGKKPPDTGTGWKYPIDTRANLRDNIHEVGGLADDVEEWYGDLQDAVRRWPEEGTVIHAPQRFKGIFGGARSDVDVTNYDVNDAGFGTVRLEGTTREVSNEPSSAFHNNTLNDKFDRQELWQRYGQDSQIMPWDLDGLLRIISTPHVASPHHEEELAVLSFDFGWTDTLGRWDGKALVPPSSEGLKFGADQLTLWGIWTQVTRGGHLCFYPSGAPWTASAYLPLIGLPLDRVIKEEGLKVRYYQIGDDIHAIGPTDDLRALYHYAPEFMRIKGMTEKENFILGTFGRWDAHDKMHAIQDPRVFKTVSSAQKSQYLPNQVPPSFEFPRDYLDPSRHADAVEASRDLWNTYPEMIYWTGTPDEYRQHFTDIYRAAKGKLVEAGHSEWIEYVFDITETYDEEY